jgi:DNA invertase Pin-like site-specific DNA recombinase
MQGQVVGYVRVSTLDQNTDRQLAGFRLDKIFEDKASGKDTNRPAFKEMMEYLRAGDKLIVHSMDRLSRKLVDLKVLVDELTKRGVSVQFVKEGMTFTGEDSPMANFMLSMMGACAEFERAVTLERQREGIAIAKAKKVYSGGKKVFTEKHVLAMIEKLETGISPAQMAKDISFLGLTRSSGKPITTINRSTIIRLRNEYMDKHPEAIKKYPRLALSSQMRQFFKGKKGTKKKP